MDLVLAGGVFVKVSVSGVADLEGHLLEDFALAEEGGEEDAVVHVDELPLFIAVGDVVVFFGIHDGLGGGGDEIMAFGGPEAFGEVIGLVFVVGVEEGDEFAAADAECAVDGACLSAVEVAEVGDFVFEGPAIVDELVAMDLGAAIVDDDELEVLEILPQDGVNGPAHPFEIGVEYCEED